VSAATITAPRTGIVGIAGAVTSLVGLFIHNKNHPGA
jgi:hypothetical protein